MQGPEFWCERFFEGTKQDRSSQMKQAGISQTWLRLFIS
jgi:hypothetical protein